MPANLKRNCHRAAAAQSNRCCYCTVLLCLGNVAEFAAQHKLSLRQARTVLATAEHKIPRSAGGSNRVDNISAACMTCNWRRGNRPDSEAFRLRALNQMRQGKWHDPSIFRAGLFDPSG